jgi:HTH-type transcriptional regulator / antitoxin HipB
MTSVRTSTQTGAILVARRKQLKLTQAQVAARLGISQNRLSELESSPATLTVEQLLTLVHVLGLELSLGEAAGKPRSKVEW